MDRYSLQQELQQIEARREYLLQQAREERVHTGGGETLSPGPVMGSTPGRPLLHTSGWLDDVFRYHPPMSPYETEKYESIRRAARHFAEEIIAQCPPCIDRRHAIQLIREAVMTANASIALDGLI